MKIEKLISELNIIVKFFFILFIIMILLNIPVKLAGQENSLQFQHISIDDGLSQSTINCIIQDNKGFLWIGTQDGLNKYDGYNFEIFYNEPDEQNSLSENWITSLFEDQNGILWVGTNNGLNRYDRDKNQFDRFMKDDDDSLSISDNNVLCFCEHENEKIWIGTDNGGLNVFDKKSEQFKHYKYDPENLHSLSDNWVLSIIEDKNGLLWIGTGNGLNLFDEKNGQFVRYMNDIPNIDFSKSNCIYSIFEDNQDALWIGTEGGLFQFDREKKNFVSCAEKYNYPDNLFVRTINEDHCGTLWVGSDKNGLFQFDEKNRKFISFQNNIFNLSSISFNKIYSIFEDRSFVLWIGTGIGLNKINRNPKKFINFKNEPMNQNSLSDNCVWSVIEDHAGYLWIGTDNGGLNRYDRKKKQFTVYKNDPDNPESLSDNCVLTLTEDHLGAIWIGTYTGGINVFNQKDKTFTHFRHEPDDSTTICSDGIMVLFEDRSENMWVGTSAGGISKFDRHNNKFDNYRISHVDTDYSESNEIRAIIEDHTGIMWIGIERYGLVKFDPDNETFFYYKNDPSISNSLSNNSVMCIHEDQTGILWVGTSGGGLNKFDPEKEKFTHYRKKDGLPNDMIYGILEADPINGEKVGNLWLSTNKGLSKFNPKTEIFVNYEKEDGLQSDEFNGNAFFKAKSGEMFFGGVYGLNSFFPNNVKKNSYIPPVVLTDFKLFNNSVSISENRDGRIILAKNISETKEIELKYFENYFEIEFAALHYWASDKNQYIYKMEGLDEEWHRLGTRNFVSYFQMDPGKYTFKVKGSNSDGVWNPKPVSLQINIIPPFWQKIWFKVFGYSFIVVLILLGHRIRTRFIRNRNTELEEWNTKLNKQVVERKKAEDKIAASLKEKEILLKEIHHRVKNNLQVISSLLYLQSNDIDDEKASRFFKESQNRVRSIAMVHERLYQSENLAQIDFFEYIKSIVSHLIRSYSINQTEIKLNLDVINVKLDIDTAISCGLIITELVTNSLKYAFLDSKKGEINISFQSPKDTDYELIVGDSGVGLPPDFNFKESKTLGLKLVNELVDQLNGTIEHEKRQGNSFKIKFLKKNRKKVNK